MVFTPTRVERLVREDGFFKMSDTNSPLARLVLFIVCLSIAGSFVAGLHYVAVDLPRQQNVQPPSNDCPIPFGTQLGTGCYLYRCENDCCYGFFDMVNTGTNYCCHDAHGKVVTCSTDIGDLILL